MRSSRNRDRVAVTRRLVLTLAVVGLCALAGWVVPADAADTPAPGGVGPLSASGDGLYLVTLAAEPAASYTGGVKGLAATRPKPGERFDRASPRAEAYREYLLREQDRVLDAVGASRPRYRYTTTLNGVAVDLNAAQVKRLRGSAGVERVEHSTTQHLESHDSTDFLGLPGPRGVWRQHGGARRAGNGVVVGVVDSGVWPENPSFAAIPQQSGVRTPRRPAHFHGACADAEQWEHQQCNNKLVSARWFVKGFGAGNLSRAEYLSARDGTGHGSQVAALAAGNSEVSTTVEGEHFGTVSGVAPAARLAIYKACWAAPNPGDDGCTTADTVAAVDQAVADGVDVVNYSVSGSTRTAQDTVQEAFRHAAQAGVFVAAPAGNEGPGPGSVGHLSPWVTTAAASSFHAYQGAVRLGNGASYVGSMVSDRPVQEAPLVLGREARAPGASPEEARLCEMGALDAARVENSVVLCDRGVVARVDKSAAVRRAGGVGMVLANTYPRDTAADFHSVPSVHVTDVDGRAIAEYARTADSPTASLDPEAAQEAPVPQIAEFSSRGPGRAPETSVVKPDLSAPGVSLLAAVAPPTDSGRLWDLASGTSMSAPHVAGLAALAEQVHPDWGPARIKSALMTTAVDVTGPHSAFSQGAGQVDPSAFLDPGLSYDLAAADMNRYAHGHLPLRNLNLPSVEVDRLTRTTTVRRHVTNVSDHPESYSARITGLDGVDATVLPRTLSLDPGETKSFRVRISAGPDADYGVFTSGSLTWIGQTDHTARIPVAVRPVQVDAPRKVSGEGPTGQLRVRGRSGTSAAVPLRVVGPAGALPTPVSLTPGRFDPDHPTQDEDTLRSTVTVSEGTRLVRFAADADSAKDDLDLYVYRDDALVAESSSAAADASIVLDNPRAGRYRVFTHAQGTKTGAATGKLFTWVVDDADTGTLRTDRPAVEVGSGDTFGYQLSWSGLDTDERWFGAVAYGAGEDGGATAEATRDDDLTLVTIR